MNKADRLYKLQNGTETAVWAHDEIVNQDKRIAEFQQVLYLICNSQNLSELELAIEKAIKIKEVQNE